MMKNRALYARNSCIKPETIQSVSKTITHTMNPEDTIVNNNFGRKSPIIIAQQKNSPQKKN